MRNHASTQGPIRFGSFLFDPRSGDLAGDGVTCRLSDQPLALLMALLEQPGQLVTREELRQRLWPDGTFVDFDHGLNSAVSRLREALKDSAATPRFVETVPRRGYRLLVPVDVPERDIDAATSEAPPPERVDEPSTAVASAPRQSRWLWTAGAAIVVLAAVAWFAPRLRTGTGPEPLPVRLLTVTSFPGSEGGPPSLSPDGNFVAFNWTGPDFSAPSDLWVKAVESDALTRLTNTPNTTEVFPAWSPDGRLIAFGSGQAGVSAGIHVISPLGGTARKIIDSGVGATWLPDSRSLVYFDRTDKGLALFHHVLATGAHRQLTTPPAGFNDRDPKVSPDGRNVAFVRTAGSGAFGGASKAALFVVPTAGGEPVRLDDWVGAVVAPVWTPDSREILFTRRTAADFTAFRVAVSGGPATPAVGLPSGAYQLSTSGYRRDGTFRVAVVDAQSDVGLRMIDLQGPQPDGRVTAWTTFCDSTRRDWPGRFSRDGTQVTFTSDRDGQARAYMASRDGSRLRTVTDIEGMSVGLASWSPDGRSLVFDAVDGENLTDLFVTGIEDRPLIRLTHDEHREINPEWSRDGRWIYYESYASGRPEIWRIAAAGGTAVQLTTQEGIDPRESPDGRSVYFLQRGSGPFASGTLKRLSLDNGNVANVLSGIYPGRWDVVDDGIVFLTGASGLSPDPAKPDALEFYNFKDGRTRRLGELPFPVMSRGYSPPRVLAVSPDGRWALLAHMDHWARDIIVADNYR
ncbi:Transcriptional activator CadC [Luteitalea pratensis]|uniref:Transcriptional activator CadC n=1 Tax=Luteitalea pratensis TaxID=1855912 RepID=A0A143PKR8_LUTPR|nr:winged helix-turn-helix domain-containing protein [Luteitalea pratensis]AMY09147.1 Transcriptional activator CadC [Luteitalea pratensis]